jgi:DeoR/GlpR family transcriptional regulator of sugar metabolism
MTKRLDEILRILSIGNKVSVNELSSKLNVSPATIRQDLSSLENEGFLKRVHGGAVLNESDDISHRMAINYNEKVKIAKKAAEFIKEGDTIFVESGSINALFVKEIAFIKDLTIITSNAFIARSIDQSVGCNVVLLGGVYQEESESIVGNLAKLCINTLNFSKVFLGIDGYTFNTGITGRDMMRSEIASLVVAKGTEIFVLTDSSKFGRINMSKYCSLEKVDHIITDSNITSEYKDFIYSQTDLIIT